MNLVDLNIPSGSNSPLVMQYAGRIQLLRPVQALLSRTAVACRVTIEQRTDRWRAASQLVNVNIKAVKEERRDDAESFTDGAKPDWPRCRRLE